MRPTALQIVLLVLLAAMIAGNIALTVDPQKRNWDFFPEMVFPVPGESFSASALFEDGMTMRQPVAGTIVRGRMPFRYGNSPEEAARAGRELVNPFPEDDEAALARGAAVFATFCEVCHGPAALGDGVVSTRGFPAPPSLLAPKAMDLADGQIFHILTRGQANMPSYAGQIEPDDRWRVIRHVRRLQKGAAPAETPTPERTEP